MDGQYLSILLFAIVAVGLVFRLRAVLGRKTGTERPLNPVPRPMPRGPATGDVRTGAPNNGFGQVIDLAASRTGDAVPVGPLQTGLAAITAADENFTPQSFVEGAAHAFGMIVKAFAENDTATLRRLLSDEVYDAFNTVIRDRIAERHAVEHRVLRLNPPEIISAQMEGNTASITVKFTSSQIHVTRDVMGNVIDGNETTPIENVDAWTFSRNVRSLDPNWVLSAAEAHD